MTEQPSVEALVERVRRPVDSILYVVPGWTGPPDWRTEMAQDALAALDSLTAALERAERERDEAERLRLIENDLCGAAEARAQKAEARADNAVTERQKWQVEAQKAEAERDDALRWAKAERSGRKQERTRADRAEVVVEAARQLAAWWPAEVHGEIDGGQFDAIRAALTAYDEPPTEQR